MDQFTVLIILGTEIAVFGLITLVVSLVLSWLGRRETVRGDKHLTELAHMSAHSANVAKASSERFWAENERFWRDHEKFWERADKRWADHEALMRMIFERVDRDKRSE